MSKSMIKYARGTIWMTKNPSAREEGIQGGTRPFLILSNNDRGDSPVVEGVWCTSAAKPPMRINVSYRNEKGELNTILCNQHTTVHISQFIDYCGTLSDDKMRDVEEGMLYACGMGRYIELEKNFNKLLQTIQDNEDEKIKSYLEGQMEEITRINLIISQLQSNLQKKLACPERMDTTLEIKTPIDKGRDDVHARSAHSSTPTPREVPSTDKSQSKRRPHGYWTEDRMRDFVHDKESMPLSALCDKYGVTKGSACQMYYNFKNKLDSKGE